MFGIRALLTGMVLCVGWNQAALPQQEKDRWVPSPADVQELEKHLTRPDPAQLTKSNRFYYGLYNKDGRKLIRGEILTGKFLSGDMKIHIQPQFPLVMDGGCSIINLLYDPETHAVLSFRCNGFV